MARILYGVHGTGHGHAIRALAVARHFRDHEFLFVTHGDGRAILEGEYPVREFPNPETVVSSHRVRPMASLGRLLEFRRRRPALLAAVREVAAAFRADVALTDYECLVPEASRALGVPCLALDHQHIVPLCSRWVPWWRRVDFGITVACIRGLFGGAERTLITSFFEPPVPPRDPRQVVTPPLLREAVLSRTATDGDHVLAYQGYETFAGYDAWLGRSGRPVAVYGSTRTGRSGNLTFKPRNEAEFIADLAGCAYVVCGGGHSLISEALYYGKPVFSIPVRGAIEQYLNATRVEALGYGRMLTSLRPEAGALAGFERGLEGFRSAVRSRTFCGNARVFDEIERFIRERVR